MRVTILGCGTSGGVPRIGGVWGVCDRKEPRNRRMRASILVEDAGKAILVDTSPDLRTQCLDNDIRHLDAVLYTHEHADHTHGIDELRAFSMMQKARVPIYADAETLALLTHRFGYIFASNPGYPAICNGHEIDLEPFRVAGVDVVPFRQQHGWTTSLGFRFNSIAYSTDLNFLDEEAFTALEGVEVWIVDALRLKPHVTHAHLELTLEWIARLRPKRAILTHMTWEMDYQTLVDSLPRGVEPAYDGMVIEI